MDNSLKKKTLVVKIDQSGLRSCYLKRNVLYRKEKELTVLVSSKNLVCSH